MEHLCVYGNIRAERENGRDGRLRKWMGPVEANHIFLNVPKTKSTPGKRN